MKKMFLNFMFCISVVGALSSLISLAFALID